MLVVTGGVDLSLGRVSVEVDDSVNCRARVTWVPPVARRDQMLRKYLQGVGWGSLLGSINVDAVIRERLSCVGIM